MAYSFACSTFQRLGNLFAICILLIKLWTHEHAMFLMPLSSGGKIELFVYMLVQGSYLSGVYEIVLWGDGRCLGVGAGVASCFWCGCSFV